jgi:outer membrane lipoprotein
MRRVAILVLALLSLVSCAIPVLRSDLLDQGIRDVSMTQLAGSPQLYKGKLFILGGRIVSISLTETGSVIEAVHIPADSAGYFKETQTTTGRYLALYPRELGVLDSMLYNAGRLITLAGEFTQPRPGRIGEKEYTFPCFVVRQIYLWPEGQTTRGFPSAFFSTGFGVGRW